VSQHEHETRELLQRAAGDPDPGDLLTTVRGRVARRRRRQLASVVGAVLILAAGVGTAVVSARPRALPPATIGPPPNPVVPIPSPVIPAPPTATATPTAPAVPRCQATGLTAAPAVQQHVLAGTEAFDVALTTATACLLRPTDLTVTPDATVPVRRLGTAQTLRAGGTAHLVLQGESDGFCLGVAHAQHAQVALGGTVLTRVTLPPSLGLCTTIDATLQTTPAQGEQQVNDGPTCLASQLTGLPAAGTDSNWNLLLRNTSGQPCQLQGYPTSIYAVTPAGVQTELAVTVGKALPPAVVLLPGELAAVALTVGPGPPCLKPSDVPATFVELRLAINAGVVAVPSASGYTIPDCSVVSAGPFHPADALPTATSSSSPTMTPNTTPGSSVASASADTTCVASNLSARVTSSEAALQKQYLQVKVTNIGAAACLLFNPPSLHLRNTVTGAAGPPARTSEDHRHTTAWAWAFVQVNGLRGDLRGRFV